MMDRRPDEHPAPLDFAALAPMKTVALVRCYNEALTIGAVVSRFRTALPGADIIVYDNNSSNDTGAVALEAGAQVFNEPMQGKGNVERQIFLDINADFSILVDGNDTYDAEITFKPSSALNIKYEEFRLRRTITAPTNQLFSHKFIYITG